MLSSQAIIDELLNVGNELELYSIQDTEAKIGLFHHILLQKISIRMIYNN